MSQNRKITIKRSRMDRMPKNEFTLENFLKNETQNSNQVSVSKGNHVIAQNIHLNLKTLSPIINLKSKKKEQEFEDSIIDHINSPETMKEISKVVGTPLVSETEDQFVERSIKSISNYLLKKFD